MSDAVKCSLSYICLNGANWHNNSNLMQFIRVANCSRNVAVVICKMSLIYMHYDIICVRYCDM